ncbi:MAG: phosphoglucomutase/phosphomannomutase family protein [Actinobacteria bacterium]|nr:phosphoglucomutase/phosphomannomutase family protein [Actinomycetota bacterium]
MERKKVIKFGTDGWRGVIADDFTMDNVKIVTRGICEYLKLDVKTKNRKPRIVVGYDTRFLSDRFAEVAADIFAENGIETYLSNRFVPTPVLSGAVVSNNADLGVMITASHNPYYYNGYKIKGPYGGSATIDIVSRIEKRVNDLVGKNVEDPGVLLEPGSFLKQKDFVSEYQDHILGLVDVDAIKGFNFRLLIDPMYGATQKIYRDILQKFNPGKLIEIHSVLNPAFGGINPEPIGDNLKDAIEKLSEEKCELAICLDGDGDRVAALGRDGIFVSSHHIFAVILLHLIRNKKLEGKVIKTVSTSSIIDRICSRHGLELVVTPIGFKYISEEILKGGVIMGGEESGGIWVKGNIPERDGMFIGLVLLEIINSCKKSINDILEDIYDEFGYFTYQRLDYEMSVEERDRIREKLSEGIPDLLKDEGVKEVVMIDGFKYILSDGSWVMIRPSGTEAVVRIYAESDSKEKLERLHRLGKKVIYGLL